MIWSSAERFLRCIDHHPSKKELGRCNLPEQRVYGWQI